MAEVMTGGCQCGAVRYSLTAPCIPVYACHCRECQRQSASAFGLSIPVRQTDFTIEGQLGCYERQADSGARTSCFFCLHCGTRIYHRSDRSPDLLTLKGGTLDRASALRPVAHIWVSSRQPWLILDDDVPQYPTQPDDLAKWRAGLMGAER